LQYQRILSIRSFSYTKCGRKLRALIPDEFHTELEMNTEGHSIVVMSSLPQGRRGVFGKFSDTFYAVDRWHFTYTGGVLKLWGPSKNSCWGRTL